MFFLFLFVFFFSSRRRHTRCLSDWSSDVCSSDLPRVPVSFDYADESDPGPYPIPPDAPIEGGASSTGDRHVLVVDRDACRLYETYASYPVRGGAAWTAGSGAIFDLNSNALRP